MSDQPNITPATTTPPSTQSLDEILNQLEKATGTSPGISNSEPSATPATPTPEPPPVPAEAAPVMPAEPVSQPPVESTPVTPSTDPAPVSDLPPMNEVTSAPVVESTPEPAPVATLPENDIPAPPPAAPSEPAPMVKEEPSLDMGTAIPVEAPASEVQTTPEVSVPEPMPTPEPVESTPVEAPPEAPQSEPVVEPAAEPEPSKKSGGSGGKIIAGVIGVLLLAGAAGAGVFLTQQNQETRSPATSQTSRTATPTVAVAPATGKVIGTICKDTRVKTPGKLTAFEVGFSKSFDFYIAPDVDTFTLDLDPGLYTLYFKQEGSDATFGQTVYQECSKTSNNCKDHSMQSIVVTGNSTSYALVCDASADIKKVAEQ